MNDAEKPTLQQRLIEYGAKRAYREYLATIPDLTFIGFEKRHVHRTRDIFTQLERYDFKDYEALELKRGLIPWVIAMLKKYEVRGEYFIDFTAPGTSGLPSGVSPKVQLGQSYAWVEPLWQLNFNKLWFLFVSADGSQYLRFERGHFEDLDEQYSYFIEGYTNINP